MEKKWVVRKSKVSRQSSNWILRQLLANRGLTGKDEVKEFLNPKIKLPGIRSQISDLDKAVKRLKEAEKRSKPIIIHGDFDVDGLCGTAILWEAIYYGLGYKNVRPFIPNRFAEGYGLSKESIDKIIKLSNYQVIQPPLLVTVDCGITAVEAVEYAKSLGMEVVITDHHIQPERLPDAEAIAWTDRLSGAGIAWVLANRLQPAKHKPSTLDLVALATVADLQPLLGANRALVKAGLLELNQTPRAGLKALIKEAGLEGRKIGTYEVGWILSPRLNAAGRLETAQDALRLLCTKDDLQAAELAEKLSVLNAERQRIMDEVLEHTREHLAIEQSSNLTIAAHKSYHEGVVGLVASKLVQEYYRPALVISKGEAISKGSARSIAGFDIIAALRKLEGLFEDLGGHPMAAGFTIRTENIAVLREKIPSIAKGELSDELLQPILKIDAEVEFSDLTWDFFESLKKFEPHGIGNSRPVFLTKNVEVSDLRPVGAEGKHLKLLVTSNRLPVTGNQFSAIFFNAGDWVSELAPGDKVDIVYNLEEIVWNGQRKLELKVKDLRKVG